MVMLNSEEFNDEKIWFEKVNDYVIAKVNFEGVWYSTTGSTKKDAFEDAKRMISSLKVASKKQPYINTAQGRAKFVTTEKENQMGRWNDNYYTRDGYYVIHDGKEHHVYKVE